MKGSLRKGYGECYRVEIDSQPTVWIVFYENGEWFGIRDEENIPLFKSSSKEEVLEKVKRTYEI
jgi:hypothetical protein